MRYTRVRRGRSRKRLKLIAVVALMTVLYFSYQSYRYNHLINTVVDETNDTGISLLINTGDSVAEIASALGKENLIVDENIFKNYVRREGYDRKIVAGRFMLRQNMTIPEIVNVITDSKQSQFVLTVPEGSTIIDIDKKLVELELITPGGFITATKNFNDYNTYPFLNKNKVSDLVHPLEGFLFPDTYFIDPTNFDSEELIHLMLDNFEKKMGSAVNPSGERSLFEIITMASIVEKEVRTEKDLPIVAGILWKRFDNHWQLGADATLLYLKDDRDIDYKDLGEDSPYNTRKVVGLPPGPISNPGLKSIMATVHPEETPYFFYLTKPGSGEVVYAITNYEHNINKQKYL